MGGERQVRTPPEYFETWERKNYPRRQLENLKTCFPIQSWTRARPLSQSLMRPASESDFYLCGKFEHLTMKWQRFCKSISYLVQVYKVDIEWLVGLACFQQILILVFVLKQWDEILTSWQNLMKMIVSPELCKHAWAGPRLPVEDVLSLAFSVSWGRPWWRSPWRGWGRARWRRWSRESQPCPPACSAWPWGAAPLIFNFNCHYNFKHEWRKVRCALIFNFEHIWGAE